MAEHEPSELLQRQNDHASTVKFLLDGTASAYQLVEQPYSHDLAGRYVKATLASQMKDGAMFGAESFDLHGNACYSYSVQATTAVQVLELPTRILNKSTVGKRLLSRLGQYAMQELQAPDIERAVEQELHWRSVSSRLRGAHTVTPRRWESSPVGVCPSSSQLSIGLMTKPRPPATKPRQPAGRRWQRGAEQTAGEVNDAKDSFYARSAPEIDDLRTRMRSLVNAREDQEKRKQAEPALPCACLAPSAPLRSALHRPCYRWLIQLTLWPRCPAGRSHRAPSGLSTRRWRSLGGTRPHRSRRRRSESTGRRSSLVASGGRAACRCCFACSCLLCVRCVAHRSVCCSPSREPRHDWVGR